jgi:hypothetical protein
MTANYTTAAEVKQYSGNLAYTDFGALFATDAAFITFIETVISRVERVIDDYCRVPATFFKAAGLTLAGELHDGPEENDLLLNYRPVISVTSLYVNEASNNAAADWVIRSQGPGANKHFLLYLGRGLIRFFEDAPGVGDQNVKATYVAGYSTTPGPITQVCAELSADVLKAMLNRKLAPEDMTEIALAGGDLGRFYAASFKLSRGHQTLLAPYYVGKVSAG